MEAVLFGLPRHRDTDSVLTLLSDLNKVHRFVDLKSAESSLSDTLSKMCNTNTLPILADEGVIYIGIESIRRHCRS